MSNNLYNNSVNSLSDNTIAKASDVEAKFNEIVVAFDAVDTILATLQSMGNATAYTTSKEGGYSEDDAVFSPTTGIFYWAVQDQAEGAVQPLSDADYWTATPLDIVRDTTPQLGGDLDGNGKQIKNIALLQTTEKWVDLGDTGGGTVTADISQGNIFALTVSAAETTLEFSNVPTGTGINTKVELKITNGGSQLFNWPAGTLYSAGVKPKLKASGIDVVTLETFDGTNWILYHPGMDLKVAS